MLLKSNGLNIIIYIFQDSLYIYNNINLYPFLFLDLRFKKKYQEQEKKIRLR